MRGVAQDRALDAGALPAQSDAPCQRAAPIVPYDRESLDLQRIGKQEDIANQFVGRVVFDAFGLGRSAIAALVRRDAAVPVTKRRDLVAPGTVAFREAVEEYQRRRIAGAGIDHVERDPVGEYDPDLIHGGQLSSSIFSM